VFYVYIEEAMKEVRTEIQEGVRIGGQTFTAIRFADDIIFCAEKEENLQILIAVDIVLKWNAT